MWRCSAALRKHWRKLAHLRIKMADVGVSSGGLETKSKGRLLHVEDSMLITTTAPGQHERFLVRNCHGDNNVSS